MASYISIILDTLAPQTLTLSINADATYTTTADVSLAIGVADGVTTGYQMKVWGINGVATEVAATWETFATSKSVTLTSGDGQKTVSVKVRDDAGNETSVVTDTIILDTTVPAATVTSGPDVAKISKVVGFNASVFSFTVDTPFVEYKVKVVPTTNSIHTSGTLIAATGGSTNTSGSGAFAAATPINVTIYGADLETASAGDGTKIVKVFVKDAAGLWSDA